MLLLDSDNRPFCTGVSSCTIRPAAPGESTNKLFVEIEVNGDRVRALVDTGGAYLVLDPDMAFATGANLGSSMGEVTLLVRGQSYKSFLYRLPVRFYAMEGDELQVDVTAFVPDLEPWQSWSLPTFLGWHCCLERIRFAIDPVKEQFFFGDAG